MAKIVMNPRVPDRIRVVEFERYAGQTGAQAEELTDWYENGDLIMVKNYRFRAGRDVFNKVVLPNVRGRNKLLLHIDEALHGEGPRVFEWQAAKEGVEASGVPFEQFEAAVRAANAELLQISDQLFPFYQYSKRYCIYNLAEMLAHNMHFDSPEHAGDCTQLRAFVNIDKFPRIWRIGGSLEDMAGNCYRTAKLQRTIRQHARVFTRETTLASFGDRYESGAHGYPMHSIAFQPGDVWFLNPNMLAHEVVYGRRVLDGVFLFDANQLRNSDRFYPRIVERIHRRSLGPLRYWWHSRGRAPIAPGLSS
ncbi:MAG TPA: Kdo hydroxylase family protein [Sphingomicrobium sp.]|jgi:hypothetical protein